MSDTHETIADIIAEARDKYTVHECNQCAWRKCCSEGFGSEKCGKFRESIFLKLGIEDGYFTQLLDRLEAAHRREVATTKESLAVGNSGDCAKLREALGNLRAELWNNTVIAGKRKFGLYEIADAALAAPPRNCDLPEVAKDPWRAWLDDKSNWDEFGSPKLEIHDWLLAPATEKEGGAK